MTEQQAPASKDHTERARELALKWVGPNATGAREHPNFPERIAACASDIADALSAAASEREAAPSPSVVDYTSVTAAEIVGGWQDKWNVDQEQFNAALDDLELEVRRALSAAAIRAFGQRVWSDGEEVAYQAGVSDTRARFLEQDAREAIKAAMRERDFARDGEYLPDDCYEVFADAALTKVAEMLK